MTSDIRSRLTVPLTRLRLTCDPETAVPSAEASDIIGQDEAMASVDLGLQMNEGSYCKSHYNIVVVGLDNTGRTSKTEAYVCRHAASIDKAPDDALCLPDFQNQRRPSVVFVPNGQGNVIKEAVQAAGKFVSGPLKTNLEKQRQSRGQALDLTVKMIMEDANKKMGAHGHMVIPRGDTGFIMTTASIKRPGQPMSQEEGEELEENEPEVYEKLTGEMRKEAEKIFDAAIKTANSLVTKHNAKSEEKDRQMVTEAVADVLKPLTEMADGIPLLQAYLSGLQDMLAEIALDDKADGNDSSHPMIQMMGQRVEASKNDALKLMTTANLLVDNTGLKHPPVVYLEVPKYSDTFGKVNIQFARADGTVSVDHTMVDAGALLQANGGYLIVNLDKMLQWGGGLTLLKLLSTIESGKLRIEGKAEFADVGSLIDYHTKDTPIDVRVIALCSPYLAWALRRYLPDFSNLFRINSEFETEMPSSEAPAAYAAYVELCRADGSLPEFDRKAVARLVEYGVRRSGDQLKATTEFGLLKDVITEAAHWSNQEGADTVMSWHVEKAIKGRFDRSARRIRRYQEHLDRGVILWNDSGQQVGQINGLVVLALSDEVVFGAPSKITARAFAGKEKVVLVQREVDLSGPSSNTAVAVIRGWLSGQYGRRKPLGLAVQLSFEQCYGGVDGDSASLAEAVAIVSAITGLPIDQRLAITGSMNQWGQAQPIGGVNYKLEGHFDALQRRGQLTAGSGHGAIIPVQNVDNLMLDRRVVKACTDGRYQVMAVEHVDQALELLLHKPAEEIHKLVEKSLRDLGPKPWHKRIWQRLRGASGQPKKPLDSGL